MNLLIKQNVDILKFSYRNLEEFSAAVNNDTEEKLKLSDSSELSDS